LFWPSASSALFLWFSSRVTIVPYPGLNTTNTTNTTKLRRYAVCVVGAVRSMTEPGMVHNFGSNFLKHMMGSRDVFFYLYVGKELSKRGQDGLTTKHAPGLVAALRRATLFQFQYEENTFTCGQQSTGRFYKQAQCANMVLAHQASHGIRYQLFVLTRPDLFYRSPFPAVWFRAFSKRADEKYKECMLATMANSEVLAISGSALNLVARLPRAACCDNAKRLPAVCFSHGLEEPNPNYIFLEHFLSHGCSRIYMNWSARIQRDVNFSKRVPRFNTRAFHGKFRRKVQQNIAPRMSRAFTRDELHLVASSLPAA